MRILWCVNIKFPDISSELGEEIIPFGGWMVSLANDLSNNSEIKKIAIATVYSGTEMIKKQINNIIYYLIPGEKYKFNISNKYNYYWSEIIHEFSPDVIHIHGTEYCHGYNLLKLDTEIPCIISIQGILSEIAKKYYSGISINDIIKNITMRDILKMDSIIQEKRRYLKRANNEKYIINKAKYIIGRTEWDRAVIWSINSEAKYFSCNESLREDFYSGYWDISNINRRTIFVSQGNYPIKGLHILIEAISYVKTKYPDTKVIISGYTQIRDNNSFSNIIKITGYTKYIRKLILKYNLSENIEFIGVVNSKGIKENLLKANVFVMPSFIENSPNSLGEAQLIGTPCIASFVGGIPSMIKDYYDGILYNSEDACVLASKIIEIFENDKLAISISNGARESAIKRHNKKENESRLINIYKEIIND